MRKFRFRFEAVLKQRKAREEQALIALGKAQRIYQSELDRKSELEKDLNAALIRREALGADPNRKIGVSAYLIEQDFIGGTKQRIIQQNQAILRASRGVEKALRTFLTTRRATRTMELLSEKAFIEWKKSEAKRDQRILDDMVVMRAHWNELNEYNERNQKQELEENSA